WWKITPTQALADSDPKLIRWQWKSGEQGAESGCEHTIFIVPDNPPGIVLSPLQLSFEAERGGPLPAEQRLQLWTGGGLAMPWTAQPSEWWLDAQPVSGNQSTQIAVQPNSTMLDEGAHGAEILLAATPEHRRVEVTYVIRKSTGVGESSAPGALTLDAWPQPVSTGTGLHVRIGGQSGEICRLTLHDLLGRERVSRTVESGRSVSLDLGVAQLTAGVYLLRAVSDNGTQAVRMISVVR
ncbi:MAG: T9SS type A sorting domain-containing protein, partial [Bacteroidetes bacterium]|nr:T9SS type A sorting domain-containing protein [Bacteroidota bacterium]